MAASPSGSITGLPTLGPALVHGRRGSEVRTALQLLDLRGGPTDPIGVRAVGVEVPDDPSQPYRRPEGFALDVSAKLDPRSGELLDAGEHTAVCAVEPRSVVLAEGVRRFVRARTGVNRRSAMERRGWRSGVLLTRQQLFPLEPPHLVWLDGGLWEANEVCCVTPTCPCQDLYIDFTRVRPSRTAHVPLSATLDVSRMEVTGALGDGPIRELAMAWLAQPGGPGRARDVFASGHGVGKELFNPFAVQRGLVNPRSRCLCGSAKRYKSCCGRARTAPVPGDLHALQRRARAALIAFAPTSLGAPLQLPDAQSADLPVAMPSEASRWAWLLYWRRFDGFTLADRFLADPKRGDPWLRCWLEAASGTPLDVFEVLSAEGQVARIASLSNPDAVGHDVLLAAPDELRAGEVVLTSPVRVMGRTVLQGAWAAPSNGALRSELTKALMPVCDEIERMCRPERVLNVFSGVAVGASAP